MTVKQLIALLSTVTDQEAEIFIAPAPDVTGHVSNPLDHLGTILLGPDSPHGYVVVLGCEEESASPQGGEPDAWNVLWTKRPV